MHFEFKEITSSENKHECLVVVMYQLRMPDVLIERDF